MFRNSKSSLRNFKWIYRMVSVLALSAVDCGFEPRSGQTKDYENGICCFSAKHTSVRSKNKDWFSRSQDNVFECSDMSTYSCCFNKNVKNVFFINVWRTIIFDIYFTEFGAAFDNCLTVLFKYCYTYCYSDSRKLWAVMKGGVLAL